MDNPRDCQSVGLKKIILVAGKKQTFDPLKNHQSRSFSGEKS